MDQAVGGRGSPGRVFRVLVTFGPSVVPKHQRVRDTDSGSRLYFTEGDTLIVRLPATPSTGYGWVVLRNSPVLKQAGEPQWEPAPSSSPGAEGAQLVEFHVTGPGSAWLELGYKRPFEKDSAPTKTSVRVRRGGGVGEVTLARVPAGSRTSSGSLREPWT